MVDEPLAHDRPTAVELLDIMAETMQDIVVPATAPHAQHQARVVANLCRILGRQLSAETGATPALPASLLTADDETAAEWLDHAEAIVRTKLAIVKPGYDAHDAKAEADAVR